MTKRTEAISEASSTKKSKHSTIVHDGDPLNDASEAPFLKLFTAPTTNGQKVTILLELLGIEYIFRSLSVKDESKTEWYLKLNPAGKIPLIEDVDAQGNQFTLAESGAILLYLASKYDNDHKFSYPEGTNEHWKELEFILFHASGLNPEQKNYNLTKANDPDNDAAVERAIVGTERAYQLVEDTLKSNGSGFLVGDHISLADIIAFPHANVLGSAGFDTGKWPLFEKWLKTIGSIPQVKAALEKK